MTLIPDDGPVTEPNSQPHRRDQCPAAFSTAQQLAAHAFRIHQVRAEESYHVQSEVCPGCLRTFHTTFRVLQHLRYRGNDCCDHINHVRPRQPPAVIRLPDHLAGVCRLPVRKPHEPLRPTSQQRELRRVREELSQLLIEDEDGTSDYAWWEPAAGDPLVHRSFAVFNAGLDKWISDPQSSIVDFHNILFQGIFSLSIPEFQAGRLFIHWVESELACRVPHDDELPKLAQLDEACLTMLSDIPIWHQRTRRRHLQLRLDRLQAVPAQAPRPPKRPTISRPARLHPIASGYVQLRHDESQRRQWRMLHRPRRLLTPVQGPSYIIHLHAGRRRHADVHHHMQSCWLPHRPRLPARSPSSPSTRPSMNP